MKLSEKTLLRISAIGLLIYAASLLVYNIVPSWRFGLSHDAKDIYRDGFACIEFLSFALACFATYRSRAKMPSADIKSRILLHLAGWTAVIFLLDAVFFPIVINGMWMVYFPPYVSAIVCVEVGLALWFISNGKRQIALPNGLTAAITIAGTACCAALLLIIIAALYALIHRHVFGFNTFCWISWVRCLTASIVLPWLAVYFSKHRKA